MKVETVKFNVEYLPDDAVDQARDRDLRALLTTCFTKPQDEVFHHRRYFAEPYPHRWIIRDDSGRTIAHTGVHEKAMIADTSIYGVAGIAEVCVHPDFRGLGLVKQMLGDVHGWLRYYSFAFAVLMGDPRIYQSSGYRSVGNLYCDAAVKGRRQRCESAMVNQLLSIPWPDGDVYIPGPSF